MLVCCLRHNGHQVCVADTLMAHIRTKTRKGSVYFTDVFRGYQSLKRYGKHHTVNHSKSMVDRRTKNHIIRLRRCVAMAR